MGNKFNTLALDDLLNDALESTEDIHDELTSTHNQNQELIPQDQVSPQINKLINQSNGLSVDYGRVYAQLQKLIENGNVALQVIAAIDPDVSGAEVGSTTASLLNAIKNCIAQFTKIHMQHIKFQQVLQLEEIKHKHKLEQLQIKKQMIEARNKNNPNNVIDINSMEQNNNENKTQLLPWQTEGINEYIKYLKQKNQ